MARTCYRCKGRRWIGYKAQTPCPVCKTTGEDPNWGDKTCRLCSTVFEYNQNWKNIPDYCDYHRKSQYKGCKGCSATIEYKPFWDNIPDYCQNCRGWKEKPCSNSHCHGTIRYKVFWDHIPDFCQQCKGWYTVTCQNSHCGQQFQAHCKWTDPPKYCKSCKGWHEKVCATLNCGEKVRIHCEWTRPPDYCETCKKLGGRRRDPWMDPRNRIERRTDVEGRIHEKIVQGPDTGAHRGYDPSKQRGFEAGKDYERRKR